MKGQIEIEDIYCAKASSGYHGGGIMLQSLQDVSVKNVTILEASSGRGSGINVESCDTVYLTDIIIQKSTGGGPLYVLWTKDFHLNHYVSPQSLQESSLLIDGSQNCFLNDLFLVDGHGFYGGALYIEASFDVYVKNVYINDSVSFLGGGINIYISEDVTFENVVIENCHATSHGGGIYLDVDNYMTILTNVTVLNNEAAQSGGGVYVSTFNDHTLWLSPESKANMKTIEGYMPDKTAQQYNFPGAERVLLFFDRDTQFDRTMHCCAELWVGNYGFNEQGFFFGTNLAPAYIYGSTVRVQFFLNFVYENAQVDKDKNYYKFYLVPIYSSANNILNPSTVIMGNQAGMSGGGMYFKHSNNMMAMVDAYITDNEAIIGDGGGINFKSSNWNARFMRMYVHSNKAGDRGGGIYAGAVQGSLYFQDSVFTANQASSGGGIYMASSNGKDTIDWITEETQNAIQLWSTVFAYNVASKEGGALYVDSDNMIQLWYGAIVDNKAGKGGGGIYLGSNNYVDLYGYDLTNNNGSLGCGGGVSVVGSDNTIYIDYVNVLNNIAYNGGGLCLVRPTFWSIGTTLVVQGNQALDVGGGVLLSNTYMWTRYGAGEVVLDGNIAQRGSALFVYAVTAASSTYLGRTVTLQNNIARDGPTVYWVRDTFSPTLPFNRTIFIAENNTFSYGEEIATQAYYLSAPTTFDINEYGDALSSPLEVEVLDFFGQVVRQSNSPPIEVSVRSANCRRTTRPYITGEDGTQGVEVSNGLASFVTLQGVCYPEGWMTVEFSLAHKPLPAVVPSNTDFNIRARTTLQFRACNIGEYIMNGGCRVCGNGSYSLVFQSNATCNTCIGVEGVARCYGNTIQLKPGYWRRHYTSTKVLRCLLSDESCPGGTGAGDDACGIGYQGPFCALCQEGYVLSYGKCILCGTTSASPSIIASSVVLAVLVGGLLVAIVVLWCRREKYKHLEDYKPWMIELLVVWLQDTFNRLTVKLKIVIATYQVILPTTQVLNVKLPTTVFNKWSQALNVFSSNLVSVMPIGCAVHVGFIGNLLLTTLGPIALLVVLGSWYIVESTSTRRKYADDINELKTRIANLKARFLNYVFYLTYLVLPSVTTMIFQLYVCKEADPREEDNDRYDYYLAADVNISCESQFYKNWKIYGYFMIIVYPIGIPAFYWACLYRYRDEILNRHIFEAEKAKQEVKDEPSNIEPEGDEADVTADAARPSRFTMMMDSQVSSSLSRPSVFRGKAQKFNYKKEMSKTAARMNFLWGAYKPKYWYWELVETSRRIMLTAVLSIISTGSSKQSVLAIMLAFIYICLYGYFQPYAEHADYILGAAGQIQIFMTYFAIIVMRERLLGKDFNSMFDALLTTLNMWVVLLGFYLEVRRYLETDADAILMRQSINKLTSKKLKGLLPLPTSNNSKLDALDAAIEQWKAEDGVGMEDIYICDERTDEIEMTAGIPRVPSSSSLELVRAPHSTFLNAVETPDSAILLDLVEAPAVSSFDAAEDKNDTQEAPTSEE